MRPDMPEEGKHRKLAETTYHRLLDDILSCVLPGGTVIQERKLALALGVSRSPMRAALNRLEGEGMLVRLNERLIVVRVIKLEDYLHSLDVRALIEPQAAELATANISNEEVRRIEQELALLEQTGSPTMKQHWEFDDLLHETLAEKSGNPFLEKTINEMRRYTKIFEQQAFPGRGLFGASDHRDLIEALKLRDGKKAYASMAQHIRNVRKRTLASY